MITQVAKLFLFGGLSGTISFGMLFLGAPSHSIGTGFTFGLATCLGFWAVIPGSRFPRTAAYCCISIVAYSIALQCALARNAMGPILHFALCGFIGSVILGVGFPMLVSSRYSKVSLIRLSIGGTLGGALFGWICAYFQQWGDTYYLAKLCLGFTSWQAITLAMLAPVLSKRFSDVRAMGEGPMCGTCDYNLTGNVSGVCPECGDEVGRVKPRALMGDCGINGIQT